MTYDIRITYIYNGEVKKEDFFDIDNPFYLDEVIKDGDCIEGEIIAILITGRKA